jgi:hypothetical protein
LKRHEEIIQDLPNSTTRALWMFLHDPSGFKRAEDSRFTDEHRGGRMWSGYAGLKDVLIQRHEASLDRFKSALREHFASRNVHVEIFDRHRLGFGDDQALVQVTIYREGRPSETLEFVEGALATRMVRPVLEAALAYEKTTGAIEIVAPREQNREELARIFCRDLLQAGVENEKLPLRRYNLQVLTRPHTFPTDPCDGIESVRVGCLRLMPLSTNAERATFECMGRGTPGDVWEMSKRHFGVRDPLEGGWRITQAKLIVHFHPTAGSSRKRTLPVTITVPHGCDLKERTERERLIGSKYLVRWGLLQEV